MRKNQAKRVRESEGIKIRNRHSPEALPVDEKIECRIIKQAPRSARGLLVARF